MTKLLILGGTGDAVNLARTASGLEDVHVIYSLAGVTRQPRLPDCHVRIGGFGGAEGLEAYLRNEGVDLVVDATHPYSLQMGANAVAACAAVKVPCLRYLRPAWTPVSGDDWREVPDMRTAAETAGPLSGRIFLTIGVKELAPFARLQRTFFLIRLVDEPVERLTLGNHRLVLGRGPFTIEDEAKLMREHRIGVVVTRNSGGRPRAAKLDAANQLGIPVVMVARPEAPVGARLVTESAVLKWIEEKKC